MHPHARDKANGFKYNNIDNCLKDRSFNKKYQAHYRYITRRMHKKLLGEAYFIEEIYNHTNDTINYNSQTFKNAVNYTKKFIKKISDEISLNNNPLKMMTNFWDSIRIINLIN